MSEGNLGEYDGVCVCITNGVADEGTSGSIGINEEKDIVEEEGTSCSIGLSGCI